MAANGIIGQNKSQRSNGQRLFAILTFQRELTRDWTGHVSSNSNQIQHTDRNMRDVPQFCSNSKRDFTMKCYLFPLRFGNQTVAALSSIKKSVQERSVTLLEPPLASQTQRKKSVHERLLTLLIHS